MHTFCSTREPRHGLGNPVQPSPPLSRVGEAFFPMVFGQEWDHRLDLLGRKGRLVSSRPIFSRNSSISMVDSPSFSRRWPISRSWLSRGVFFIASWPASRNAARQVARRAAGSPSSRDSRSSASPRSRRNTTSVLCRAENRSGFFHPLLLPSPVALRAPCEGSSMEISCACLWTPPLRDYTQWGVQVNWTPNHRLKNGRF